MGKKNNKKTVHKTDYRMSIHFGVCLGPVDYLRRIYVAEKIAVEGFFYDQAPIPIDIYEFFGGVEKEGGIAGNAYYLPGGVTQVLDDTLLAKYGLDAATMPGYRGLTSVYFAENPDAHPSYWPKGFWWGQSPYIQSVWVQVARTPFGLDAATARIYRVLVDETQPGWDFGIIGIGNGPFHWDTNGVYLVNGADAGQPNTTIYDLRDGTSRTFAIGDTVAGLVHLTDDNEIVTRYGSGGTHLEVRDADSLSVLQTITVTPSFSLNEGALCDDIVLADGSRLMLARLYNGFTADWVLLKKNTPTDTWAIQWTEASGYVDIPDVTDAFSLGKQYAYCVYKADPTKILRVNITSFAETLVTPPSAGGRSVRFVHYSESLDRVVMGFTDGTLARYDAAVATLQVMNITGFTNLGHEGGLLCKRLELGNNVMLLHDQVGLTYFLRFYSIATMTLTRSIDVSASNLVNNDIDYTYMGVNATVGGAVMLNHSFTSSFWPVASLGDFDINPAHAIYEALINDMGALASRINFDNFNDVASTLYFDNFGISYIWTKQTETEEEINEILDHIEGTMFLNPRTGLLELKLIRNDYVVADLPLFDETNCRVTNFKRKLWGDTVNELTVSMTSPENEESISLTVQDAANIAIQGRVVPDTRDYYMIRRTDLLTSVAYRDLAAVTAPLATCDMETDRSGWTLLPGSCLRLSSPEDGVTQLVMRVGPIDYGTLDDPTIKVSLTEDVFSLPKAEYDNDLPDTAWEDPTHDPEPSTAEYAFTMPYFFATNTLPAGSPITYPNSYAMVLAASTVPDTISFQLYGETTGTTGTPVEQGLGDKSIVAHGVLADALVQEVTSTIPGDLALTVGMGPTVGGFMIIGDGDEDEVEIALITAVSADVTVARGVLDTTPKEWPIDTPFWYINPAQTNEDSNPRSVAEVVDYAIRPRTSAGLLRLADAHTVSVTMSDRPRLPTRPADCQVAGQRFGSLTSPVNCDGVDPIPITVAERNRLIEDSVVLAWDDADVTPEAGQTWQLVLMKTDRTVIDTIAGLTGTSYDLDPADLAGETTAIIRFEAELDGAISLQGHEIVIVVDLGYGYGYGLNYGGL